jgi:hypothetical protein
MDTSEAACAGQSSYSLALQSSTRIIDVACMFPPGEDAFWARTMYAKPTLSHSELNTNLSRRATVAPEAKPGRVAMPAELCIATRTDKMLDCKHHYCQSPAGSTCGPRGLRRSQTSPVELSGDVCCPPHHRHCQTLELSRDMATRTSATTRTASQRTCHHLGSPAHSPDSEMRACIPSTQSLCSALAHAFTEPLRWHKLPQPGLLGASVCACLQLPWSMSSADAAAATTLQDTGTSPPCQRRASLPCSSLCLDEDSVSLASRASVSTSGTICVSPMAGAATSVEAAGTAATTGEREVHADRSHSEGFDDGRLVFVRHSRQRAVLLEDEWSHVAGCGACGTNDSLFHRPVCSD